MIGIKQTMTKIKNVEDVLNQLISNNYALESIDVKESLRETFTKMMGCLEKQEP